MRVLSLMFLIVGGAAAVAGCTTCNGACTSMGLDRYSPAGLRSPLVDVSADSPCMAKLVGDGGSTQVMVTTESAAEGAVCVLHGRLADGQVVTATVTWHQTTGAVCCNGFVSSGGEFTVTDAGAGGG